MVVFDSESPFDSKNQSVLYNFARVTLGDETITPLTARGNLPDADPALVVFAQAAAAVS